MAAYLAEERRRDPHSVVKERPLPSGPFHGVLRAAWNSNTCIAEAIHVLHVSHRGRSDPGRQPSGSRCRNCRPRSAT